MPHQHLMDIEEIMLGAQLASGLVTGRYHDYQLEINRLTILRNDALRAHTVRLVPDLSKGTLFNLLTSEIGAHLPAYIEISFDEVKKKAPPMPHRAIAWAYHTERMSAFADLADDHLAVVRTTVSKALSDQAAVLTITADVCAIDDTTAPLKADLLEIQNDLEAAELQMKWLASIRKNVSLIPDENVPNDMRSGFAAIVQSYRNTQKHRHGYKAPGEYADDPLYQWFTGLKDSVRAHNLDRFHCWS